MNLFHTPRCRPIHRAAVAGLEALEQRDLLAVVGVNAGQVVRPVHTQLLGTNIGWFDADLQTPQTQQIVEAAGLTIFRLPGGSSSDVVHFTNPPGHYLPVTAGLPSFVASVDGQAIVTLDYGSGSPQEAAAYLAYLNAPVGSTTNIGEGEEWNTATNSWQMVNWQTAGYWASLRAGAPLAHDDGLNFLRLDHAAPFGFHDFEVGNEIYGGWEADYHGQGGDTGKPHDPATYVAFAKQFAAYAAQIDPSISIGVDTASPGSDYNNWIADVLQQCVAQGFTPGFLSDHLYAQTPGDENDDFLLFDTSSDPNSVEGWAYRSAAYEKLLTQYFGAAGKNVELLATEFNSVVPNCGKQSVSLVSGLWVADTLGVMLETDYDGALIWELRGGYASLGNNSPSLYGWRQGGDLGLIGSPDDDAPPVTGPYVPYPAYFAYQLASKFIEEGGKVVEASSSDPSLTAYAVLESNGHLELMVINKSSLGALTGQFQIAGFQPAAGAQVWQYGEAQDTAQSQTTDGHSALANFTTTLNLSGSSFSDSFPAYSMTVLDLSPRLVNSGPRITLAASATPNPVIGPTTTLSVSAADPGGASGLTYTWTTTGTPPAGVNFAVNGTSAAGNTTVTFHKAGTYTFQVTVADQDGLTATSQVIVTVDQTLSTVTVSPASPVVKVGSGRQFMAVALDQFGNPVSTPPHVTWSVIKGRGKISRTGHYHAPGRVGRAWVQAAVGPVAGLARITIALKSPRQSTRPSAPRTTAATEADL
jgi:hypothetical protein